MRSKGLFICFVPLLAGLSLLWGAAVQFEVGVDLINPKAETCGSDICLSSRKSLAVAVVDAAGHLKSRHSLAGRLPGRARTDSSLWAPYDFSVGRAGRVAFVGPALEGDGSLYLYLAEIDVKTGEVTSKRITGGDLPDTMHPFSLAVAKNGHTYLLALAGEMGEAERLLAAGGRPSPGTAPVVFELDGDAQIVNTACELPIPSTPEQFEALRSTLDITSFVLGGDGFVWFVAPTHSDPPYQLVGGRPGEPLKSQPLEGVSNGLLAPRLAPTRTGVLASFPFGRDVSSPEEKMRGVLRMRDVVHRFFELNALSSDWTPLEAPEGVGAICGQLEDGGWVTSQPTMARGVRIERGIVLRRAPARSGSAVAR